jgi:hypothetical protein
VALDEHTFVSDAALLAVLDAALACRPGALRVGADQREAVDVLARVGLLIDAGDGTTAPTPAAVLYDELSSL